MSRRLQITFEPEQYDALVVESRRTGASMAELVRQAVSARLGLDEQDRAERFRSALAAAAGVWSDRTDDGLEYQRRVREPVARRVFGEPAPAKRPRPRAS